MKRFEYVMEYENKRYNVKFPKKLEKQRLDDNRKPAQIKIKLLKRRLVKN